MEVNRDGDNPENSFEIDLDKKEFVSEIRHSELATKLNAILIHNWASRLRVEIFRLTKELPEDMERHPREVMNFWEGQPLPMGPAYPVCLDRLRELLKEMETAEAALVDRGYSVVHQLG